MTPSSTVAQCTRITAFAYASPGLAAAFGFTACNGQVLSSVDTTGRGKIGIADFATFVGESPSLPGRLELLSLWLRLQTALNAQTKYTADALDRQLFWKYDKRNSGIITPDELKRALKHVKPTPPLAQDELLILSTKFQSEEAQVDYIRLVSWLAPSPKFEKVSKRLGKAVRDFLKQESVSIEWLSSVVNSGSGSGDEALRVLGLDRDKGTGTQALREILQRSGVADQAQAADLRAALVTASPERLRPLLQLSGEALLQIVNWARSKNSGSKPKDHRESELHNGVKPPSSLATHKTPEIRAGVERQDFLTRAAAISQSAADFPPAQDPASKARGRSPSRHHREKIHKKHRSRPAGKKGSPGVEKGMQEETTFTSLQGAPSLV